jgi:DNA-binding NarL/FixJ family response regulator
MPALDTITVLIADDSDLTRLSLKTTLSVNQPEGMSLVLAAEAQNGEEAVALANEHQPDVILMDIGMPVMDGIRATQAIQSQHPDWHVIMLTSHDSRAEVLEAFQSGATSYCLKDTEPDVLVKAIVLTARGESWIDPRIARFLLSAIKASPAVQEAESVSTASPPKALLALSERELDVLKAITEGMNNAEIAEKLCISHNTVKTHLKNIFQKIGVEGRTEAALKALKEHWF